MEKPNYRLDRIQPEISVTSILASARMQNKSSQEDKTFCSCFLDSCSCDSEPYKCDCNKQCHSYNSCKHCRCVDDCSCDSKCNCHSEPDCGGYCFHTPWL